MATKNSTKDIQKKGLYQTPFRKDFFRIETLVQLVASLIDIEALTEDQVEFYWDKIMLIL